MTCQFKILYVGFKFKFAMSGLLLGQPVYFRWRLIWNILFNLLQSNNYVIVVSHRWLYNDTDTATCIANCYYTVLITSTTACNQGAESSRPLPPLECLLHLHHEHLLFRWPGLLLNSFFSPCQHTAGWGNMGCSSYGNIYGCQLLNVIHSLHSFNQYLNSNLPI